MTGKIQIQTDTMEQEFAVHHRRGYQKGLAENVTRINELEAQLAGAEAEITALKQGLHRATFNNELLKKDAEWIPVSDQLPDDRKPYLVNLVNVATNEPYMAQSRLNPAKTEFYVEYDNRTDTPLEVVTHWMPLPSAPAIQAEEKQA